MLLGTFSANRLSLGCLWRKALFTKNNMKLISERSWNQTKNRHYQFIEGMNHWLRLWSYCSQIWFNVALSLLDIISYHSFFLNTLLFCPYTVLLSSAHRDFMYAVCLPWGTFSHFSFPNKILFFDTFTLSQCLGNSYKCFIEFVRQYCNYMP